MFRYFCRSISLRFFSSAADGHIIPLQLAPYASANPPKRAFPMQTGSPAEPKTRHRETRSAAKPLPRRIRRYLRSRTT
jgi:hypothetical protein